MKSSPAILSDICNFYQIGEALGTAGQPAERQFQAIRDAGYEVVINLALPTSTNAVVNEGGIVTALGMTYVHIPVDFKAPTTRDFQAFCGTMNTFAHRRVFVHCAANKRVSAFVFLYRVLRQSIAPVEADRDLRAVWQPDDVWSQFIRDQLTGK